MTLEEIGAEAAELTRQDILKACRDGGLTLGRLVETISKALDAEANRQQMLMNGNWSTSPSLTDHNTRLNAVKIAKDILGMDAPKNIKLDAKIGSDMSPETAEMVKGLISSTLYTMDKVGDAIIASLKHFSEE